MNSFSRSKALNCFIIKRTNFGEADKILTVFSKELGKMTVIAKGIRKAKSRRASSLELFNHNKMFIYQGHGIPIATETQLLDSYFHLTNNPFRLQIAYVITELINVLTKEDQIQEEIYDLMKDAFGYISQCDFDEEHFQKVKGRFMRKILILLGFGIPDLVKTNYDLEKYIENVIIETKLRTGSFSNFAMIGVASGSR